MVIQYKTRLTLAVNVLLEGSKQVTKEELQLWYKDENVMQRWRKNPMGGFMRLLAEALETESKSAENRRKEKERANKRPNLSQSHEVQTLHEPYLPAAPSLPTTEFIEPLISSLPSMSDSTTEAIISQHKRNVANATTASYGASSTESPPQSIDRPEPYVQELQNTFVRLIIDTLWEGGVPISWARGRKMWLNYVPYSPLSIRLILVPIQLRLHVFFRTTALVKLTQCVRTVSSQILTALS
jgi:hypothetical protein